MDVKAPPPQAQPRSGHSEIEQLMAVQNYFSDIQIEVEKQLQNALL